MRPNTVEAIIARGVRTDTGCLIWPFVKNSRGYGQVSFGGATWKLHRLIWISANGPVPAGYVIAHLCDTPSCYEKDHLQACTQKENIRQMYERGRNATRLGSKWTDTSKATASDAAKRRWESMSPEERGKLGDAMADSRRGKPRGPYKGRSEYARGYRPVDG